MAGSLSPSRDRRVINLAAEVAETRDRKVPRLLLRLRDILETAPVGSQDARRIRKEIWEYNLLHVLVLVLKQDFSIVDGEWETAARLAAILSQVCSGIDLPFNDMEQLRNRYLPDSVDNMFLVARRIQAHYTGLPAKPVNEKERTKLLSSFKGVMESLTYLASGQLRLANWVMKSPWLLQLLITDDRDTVIKVMDILQKLIRINRSVLNEIPENVVFGIMDELIFKLTVNSDPDIGAVATKCVLRVSEAYKPAVKSLSTRYRGLRPLLSKWNGAGFSKDLKELLLVLEAGNAEKADDQRKDRAALRIQANFRGFNARRKLAKANKAFSKFQKAYRNKRVVAQRTQEQYKQRSDLEHRLILNRQRVMREFREKHLQTMEILPAAKVESFLKNEQTQAAMAVQRTWRGYRERRRRSGREQLVRQTRAAIRIQRAVRKWFDKMDRKRTGVPADMKPSGLTDQKRVELQEYIQEWRDEHPVKHKTPEELETVHKQAAEMLDRYYTTLKSNRIKKQQRDTLMARLDTDSDLVLLAPKLQEVTDKDVQMFTSRSLPVATKARVNHMEQLKLLRQPWWKKLTDEIQDQEYDEEDYILF